MNTETQTEPGQCVALILRGPGYELDLPSEAAAARNELVEAAQTIQAVTGDASNRAAALVRSKIAGTVAFVEETRKKVKDPVFRKGQEIDRAAANFIAPLLIELERIKKLQDDHAAKIVAEQRAAEARRQQELIELARKEQELARQAAAVKDLPPETAALEAERISLERSNLSKVVVASAPVAPKVQGQTVKTEWVADVIDLAAAYAAKPHLFKPLEISPAALKAALSNGLRECPGLRIYETVKTSQRQS